MALNVKVLNTETGVESWIPYGIEEVLTANQVAHNNSIQVNSLGCRNVDSDNPVSSNEIIGNDNSITIYCQKTGRSLLIDWNGLEPTFAILPNPNEP